ncbi:MAG: hypothetical protein K6T31_10765 [Alicyclobacillus sp.]|nr:hypothetical protein [Alicyclobacillus sp.]
MRPVQRRLTWAALLLAAALLPWPQAGGVAWAASEPSAQAPATLQPAPAVPAPAATAQTPTQQPGKQPSPAGPRPPHNAARPQTPVRPTLPAPAGKPAPRPQPSAGQGRQGPAAGRPEGSHAPGGQARPPAGTAVPNPTSPPVLPQTQSAPFSPYVPWPTSKLRVRVIDGRTQQPLEGAEVVLIETEQRLRTGPDGYTPWFDAPVIRNPRYRPMVAELHGQLGVIAYKNGYRDSIHLGIRMHEGVPTETTVWMYKLGPGDTRIEPVLYQVPYHHIWLVELADRFRSSTQPGEGPERP